jgi:hypothetical protein
LDDSNDFYNQVKGAPEDFGLTKPLTDLLKAAIDLLQAKYDVWHALELQLETATPQKNAAQKDLRRLLVQLRGTVRSSPVVTDAQRESLRLNDSSEDDANDNPLGTAPLLAVGHSGVHLHGIGFFMPGEPSDSTEKPAKKLRCRLRLKIGGEATTDLKDYEVIADDSKSPYGYTHDAADAGKVAHYIGSWIDDDGNESPMSEVFSIVIS